MRLFGLSRDGYCQPLMGRLDSIQRVHYLRYLLSGNRTLTGCPQGQTLSDLLAKSFFIALRFFIHVELYVRQGVPSLIDFLISYLIATYIFAFNKRTDQGCLVVLMEYLQGIISTRARIPRLIIHQGANLGSNKGRCTNNRGCDGGCSRAEKIESPHDEPFRLLVCALLYPCVEIFWRFHSARGVAL